LGESLISLYRRLNSMKNALKSLAILENASISLKKSSKRIEIS
jgi:hypothetical protein